MNENIIKFENGVIKHQDYTILNNINIEIKEGDFVYIIGEVGSGKTSLLKTIYAELPLQYGEAMVSNISLKKLKKSKFYLLRRKCGIVFQDFKLLNDRNVYSNLEFVLRATGWKNKKAIKERISTVLKKVEMEGYEDSIPFQLSGGEQQRIVLARALLNSPSIIIADEPTGNIDPKNSYKLIELIKDINLTGKTVLIATHQYSLIEKFPGRVLECKNKTIKEISIDKVISQNSNIEVNSEIQNTDNSEILDDDKSILQQNKESQIIKDKFQESKMEDNISENLHENEDFPTEFS